MATKKSSSAHKKNKKKTSKKKSASHTTSSAHGFTPEPIPPDEPIWSRSLTELGTDLRIAVLGTSISWGQGLWPKDKAAVRCAKMLMHDPGFSKPVVASYAQSGAILWHAQQSNVPPFQTPLETHPLQQLATRLDTLSPPAEAARNFSFLDGETPRDTPTIWDQAARASVDFGNGGVKPTFVWLDAGANDLGFISTVIMKGSAECTQYIDACLRNMKASFEALLRAIWNDAHLGGVPIVITGYYRATSIEGLRRALDAPEVIDPLLELVHGDVGLLSVRERVANNMEKFRNRIGQEWRALVARLRTAGVQVHYVEPAFNDVTGEHIMFAAGSTALWPRTRPPFDSLHGHRRVESTDGSVWAHLTAEVLTQVAGFAHPNPRGALLYAGAVHSVVRTLIHP